MSEQDKIVDPVAAGLKRIGEPLRTAEELLAEAHMAVYQFRSAETLPYTERRLRVAEVSALVSIAASLRELVLHSTTRLGSD